MPGLTGVTVDVAVDITVEATVVAVCLRCVFRPFVAGSAVGAKQTKGAAVKAKVKGKGGGYLLR